MIDPIADLSRSLLPSGSIEEITSLVEDYARSLTGSIFSHARCVDPGTGYLIYPTLAEDTRNNREINNGNGLLKTAARLWKWVAVSRTLLLINGSGRDPGFPETGKNLNAHQRFLVAPAVIGEHLIGQVAVANSERNFTVLDLILMERTASLYALAIKRKWAENELRDVCNKLKQRVDEYIANTAKKNGKSTRQKKRRDQHCLREDIEKFLEKAESVSTLTWQLLALNRRSIPPRQTANLDEILPGIRGMLSILLDERVEMQASLAPGLETVAVDPILIELVVVILALSAHGGVRSRGKLVLEASNAELNRDYAEVQTGVEHDGRYAVLTMRDSERGASPDVRPDVFKPSPAAGNNGKKTGISLSTAYWVFRRYGGEIWVYDEAGKKASFRIYLPLNSTQENE